MEFDNPAASGQWEGHHHANTDNSENTDFSEKEDSKKNKKEKTLLGSAKKKDKDKKKETRYAQLGDDSSGEDEGDAKKTKKKAFKFGSAKKEKKEKREKESKEKDRDSKDGKEEKKKEKKEKPKDKPKLKLKKSKHTDSESENKGKGEEGSIFGVPLELAVERNKCHDGIKLPVIVRECIDYIEEHGLSSEGIYRSSGVKSKVNKLKAAYNNSQSVNLYGTEPSVVASLLKLFLRELPDPVLTHKLLPNFEEVSAMKQTQKRVEGMKNLLMKLPECNRVLIQWIFVHMAHVIQKEKFNKMTLQNVSIVLSPTMQISHRVLNCFFENSHALFAGVTLKKYVPPISGVGGVAVGQLPESPDGIEEEMRKQESLLSDLHLEISRGSATRAKEEQLWEQQRIVTQLKRKLRMAQKEGLGQGKPAKTKQEPIDYEEKLDFTLQTPVVKVIDENAAETSQDSEQDPSSGSQTSVAIADKSVEKEANTNEDKATTSGQVKQTKETEAAKVVPAEKEDGNKEPRQQSDGSSPDSKTEETDILEHKVTVQIHRDAEHGQTQAAKDEDNVIKKSNNENGVEDEVSSGKVCVVNEETEKKVNQSGEERGRRVSHVTVIKLGPDQPAPQEEVQVRFVTGSESFKASEANETFKAVAGVETKASDAEVGNEAFNSTTRSDEFTTSPGSDVFKTASANEAFSVTQGNELSKVSKASEASKPPTGNDMFKVPAPPKQSNKAAFPLLPPPPASKKLTTRNILKPVILPSGRTKPGSLAPPVRAGHDNRLKSKSLPRGLPSDGSVFEQWSDSSPDREEGSLPKAVVAGAAGQMDAKKKEEENLEALKWEELRLKFEYEELLNLKSELERRKRTERREIQELQEEIATMQTLYQYRTYSVDSSDSSDGEDRGGGFNQLPQLQEQQKTLEDRKLALAAQLKEERDACVRLRVHIRLEQERIKRKNMNTA